MDYFRSTVTRFSTRSNPCRNPPFRPPAELCPPKPKRETYASGFLRLMALREAIERTLHEMAALLDDDEPERVAIPPPARPRRPSASGGLNHGENLDHVDRAPPAAALLRQLCHLPLIGGGVALRSPLRP